MEKSLINRWDNRWELVSFIILTFSITFAKSLFALGFASLIIIMLVITSGLSFRVIKKSLDAPLSLLVVMSPFILLTPGSSFSFRIILLSTIFIKSITIFMIFSLLMNTSTMTGIMHGMRSIGIPKDLVNILISTYRYIFLYRADLKKLMTSARLRGFSLQKGFKHGLTSADILLTLIIRSYEQSQRVTAAMRLRGFTGDYKILEHYKTKPIDIILFILVFICSSIIIILELLC